MKYDFDRIVERRDTYSVKYLLPRGKADDVLPLWVADMDFQSPPCVIDALVKQSRHGIFGYSDIDDKYFDTLQNWFARRFDWNIERNWLVNTPNIVSAIHIAIRALTNQNDGVLIQQPVYHPFASAIRQTGRKLVVNELLSENSGYAIDFADFERKIIAHNVTMFILCNPHNPVGRVWRREELIKMGELCLRHGIIVISDEIHQDFIYEGHRHLVFAKLNPAYRDLTITCTSPSKTFNLAGLQLSNIFIANQRLREQFKQEYARCGLSQPGIMGIVACKAAYEDGDDWLQQLLAYLQGNVSFLQEFLLSRIPQVKLIAPEGTYLAWLDFRNLKLSGRELNEMILHKAKLWLNDGPMFGAGGEGFQRMNIACQRAVLQEALERLQRALSEI